jgi:hypothetical protein
MRFIGPIVLLLSMVEFVSAQDTNFSVGPQYLIPTNSAFLRPIATPTYNLDAPLPPIPELPQVGEPVENQPYIPDPLYQDGPDLYSIYYGYPLPSLVVLVSEEGTPLIPASLTEEGSAGFIDSQSPIQMDYGVPLGESASYWKTHRQAAARVYTNADIQSLQPMQAPTTIAVVR